MLSSCATGGAPTALQPSGPFQVAELLLRSPEDASTTTVPVYVAADRQSRRVGLMFRESLPAGTGMVFLYPGERSGGYVMRDTLIPLSIAFYGAGGEVLAVLDMEPCRGEPCPIYDPGLPYRGALEVNQGFFDEVGLSDGWIVELPENLPAAS